ncbi:hypothetical protein LN042_35420, partial [Kitasatospora sp. RB6PN24]|uniref:hypothetical protein n=1 Tax=Kitasatospora humi TaxID=2893891 RepID=UPI003556D460|nr:hypothetical protein [Kitasatospora humi]
MVDLDENRKQVDMDDFTGVPEPAGVPESEWLEQPHADPQFSVSLPRHPKSASAARGALRDFLAKTEGGELVLEDAELVLSELFGNA